MSSLYEIFLTGMLITAFVLAAGCTQQPNKTVRTESDTGSITPIPAGVPAAQVSPAKPEPVSIELWKRARLETSMGNITIALDPAMPVTTGNFETLVKKGFYDGLIFHRVIDGFMIQGGDPIGIGNGGPGYMIKDEFTANNRNDRGTIAMANAGPNTGGSQFFINLVNNNFLDGKHPVFGRVVERIDVVDKIGKTRTGPGDRPVKDIVIIRAEVA
jgi:cyclophilin family peptidyl-prolyl cis-trans isomerase